MRAGSRTTASVPGIAPVSRHSRSVSSSARQPWILVSTEFYDGHPSGRVGQQRLGRDSRKLRERQPFPDSPTIAVVLAELPLP